MGSGRMARWLEAAFFRWRKLGCNWVPTPACLLPFFFLSSFFYPLAFYCLFSLLTPLASRDFCENVFLVLCTKIGSFHHIDASFFIVCPLIDHKISSWHCPKCCGSTSTSPKRVNLLENSTMLPRTWRRFGFYFNKSLEKGSVKSILPFKKKLLTVEPG